MKLGRRKGKKSPGSLPSLLECQTPGAMAGNHRRPCNVPSHPFSFGVPKEVTDALAVGLESQESDCTRAPRTRDPIIGEAAFRPQSVTERATLTSRQTLAKFRLLNP